MYLARHDADAAIAVWILDRPSDEEWRRFTLDVVRVAQWKEERRPLVLFIVEHFAPEHRQTTHFVDLVSNRSFVPSIAVVTVGALARGFGAALEPLAAHVRLFEELEDAFEWLAAQRPGRLAGLRELWRETNLSRPPQRSTEPA